MEIYDYEELDMEEFLQKAVKESIKSTRHIKCLSDTLSTNNCTTDFETFVFGDFESSIEKSDCNGKKRKNLTEKSTYDLPERLNNLKQISENKIKFMKAEQEIKELVECTFRPKTNQKIGRLSMLKFSKKQMDYAKSKNSALLKLNMQNSGQSSCKSIVFSKNTDPQVFSRLYNESKMQKRTATRYN